MQVHSFKGRQSPLCLVAERVAILAIDGLFIRDLLTKFVDKHALKTHF